MPAIQILDGNGVEQYLQVETTGASPTLVTPHSAPEIAGAVVSSANPMPSKDAVAGAALGTPADTKWDGTSAASIVALLKSAASLLSTINTIQTPSALTNAATGTMGTTASIIVPYSATRKWLVIFNRTSGTETQDIGPANVAVGSGIPLTPGANAGFQFHGAGAAGPIYGVAGAPNSPFSYVEA